jgi:preprotein translocase subunit SecA
MQLKSLFGKSFEEEEINNLVNLENKEFEEKIKNKFKSSREERIKMLSEEQYNEIEKRIFLQLIDQNWKLHIQYLEQLRQVIGLRSYGQRDPLVEYKKEAFTLFENLLSKLKYDLITILFNLKLIENSQEEQSNENLSKKFDELSTKKIGRNEPCPCNSGKKYKHCHGAL